MDYDNGELMRPDETAQSGSHRKYVTYLSFIVAGVLLSFVVMWQTGEEVDEPPSALEIVRFLVIPVCGAHLAAKFLSDRRWRKSDYYVREARWSVLTVAVLLVLYLVVPFLYPFVAAPRQYAVVSDEERLKWVVVSILTSFEVLAVGSLIVKMNGGGFLQSMGLTRGSYRRLMLVGVIAFLAFDPMRFIYQTAVVRVFYALGLPMEQHSVTEELQRPIGMDLRLVLIFEVIVEAPLFEEIFYRGFFYKALRKGMSARGAMLLTALVFAMFHLSLLQICLVFPFGLLSAYLVERSGSVVPCITVHFLHNASVLIFFFLTAA